MFSMLLNVYRILAAALKTLKTKSLFIKYCLNGGM